MKLSIVPSLLLLLTTPSLAFYTARTTTSTTTKTTLQPCRLSSTTTTTMSETQASYGKDLPLPDTYVKCGQCQSSFAITADDLGDNGRGRRLTCSVCSHSWFQSVDKIFTLKDGFELTPLDEQTLARINSNIDAGRKPSFMGKSKLYVGNLDFNCEESDLLEAFSKAGEVGDVSIVRREDGRSRGFAFVTMITEDGGKKGLELDGEEFMGRNLLVNTPNS